LQNIFGKIGKTWANVGEIWEKLRRNLGKIEVEFGQTQNLASPKTFDLPAPAILVSISRYKCIK